MESFIIMKIIMDKNGGIKTYKRRISTTISAKHWELLKKYTEKFETQQKALEFALENVNNGSKQSQALSPEEEVWLRIYREQRSFICILARKVFEDLMDSADLERQLKLMAMINPGEWLVSWYYQKPLKKCSLKEVIDGTIFIIKIGNYFDSVACSEEFNCYTVGASHSLGMKGSKLFKMWFENLFEAYGVKTESEISVNGIFIKIHKNNNRG